MSVPAPAPIRHLYVHVPFCPSICPYCDFHVLTRQSGLVEQYLAQVEREAERLAAEYPVELDTVYLGGGTPSFLRDSEMAALVGSVQRWLGWGRAENTLEINPGTVSAERAAHWRALGFDRASVGVQSLHDPTLLFLGRRHSAAQARAAVEHLLAREFRVSGDLITAVAGQPLEADIRGLHELGVGHISAYTLTIEPGTEFARRGVTVSEADERRGFEVTAALLAELGYERYEISNYARPGQQSQHNLAYWHTRHYLGLGPGAAGHYPAAAPAVSMRRTNPHLHEWLAGAQGEAELVTGHDWVTDALFMGLRLRTGVNLAELSRRSGVDVAREYAPAIRANVERGLLVQEGQQLQATEAGWWILNSVIGDFLELDLARP
ncbi:oxygen-independent coproporphyrinogen III oxidase [Deinococcus proteolyticus MRP]|uniref:Heme chaperone HemW n=1 Tax=Deinococcus proteolyticus (strain ATCC 35074 / DSM 20540 / JCM 6276 / NBRC 101906 / NCIMB 13154 / VKM Ac-1939 / CCM 2703 / MRP) TaxID=693977 RepID=F0RIV5_DEIPM|nr:oxygen-independent coproporphyrinogen III oxidase [Deinococcus proteolyticus MRP]